ncbi:hypothetical protein HY641_05015 [Candidatus Woesearchaeota archaeon]|nr:hypothetical protein [Candidatus Woesearchaeota archaeon]
MSQRRAQITMWIVLAVGVLVLFAIPWRAPPRVAPMSTGDVEMIRSSIQPCIQEGAEIVLEDFTKQGDLDGERHISIGLEERAVFTNQGDVPTIAAALEQIASETALEAEYCVDMTEYPFEVAQDGASSQALLSADQIFISVHMPTRIIREGQESIISEYSVTLTYPLASYLAAARTAVEAITTSPEHIDLTLMHSQAYQYLITPEDDLFDVSLYDPTREPTTSYNFAVEAR